MSEIKVKFTSRSHYVDQRVGGTVYIGEVCSLCGSLIGFGMRQVHLQFHDDVQMYERERQFFYAQPWKSHVDATDEREPVVDTRSPGERFIQDGGLDLVIDQPRED